MVFQEFHFRCCNKKKSAPATAACLFMFFRSHTHFEPYASESSRPWNPSMKLGTWNVGNTGVSKMFDHGMPWAADGSKCGTPKVDVINLMFLFQN